MEVVFIRHGQPEWDREGLSVDNPPLTELGHRQAEVMADYVASLEIGALLVSEAPPLWKLEQPARRIVVVAHAGTNATAVGHLLGIPPVPWEWERFVSFHASLSVLRPLEINGDHAFSLFRFSDVDHLS